LREACAQKTGKGNRLAGVIEVELAVLIQKLHYAANNIRSHCSQETQDFLGTLLSFYRISAQPAPRTAAIACLLQ